MRWFIILVRRQSLINLNGMGVRSRPSTCLVQQDWSAIMNTKWEADRSTDIKGDDEKQRCRSLCWCWALAPYKGFNVCIRPDTFGAFVQSLINTYTLLKCQVRREAAAGGRAVPVNDPIHSSRFHYISHSLSPTDGVIRGSFLSVCPVVRPEEVSTPHCRC